jgi:hypothetical protein
VKIISEKVLQNRIGDSKLSIHQLYNDDKYVIAIQNDDSPDIMLRQTEDGQVEVINIEGINSETVLIQGIERKNLTKLADIILKHFPTEYK